MRELKFRAWDGKRKDMVSWVELLKAKEGTVFNWINAQDESTGNIIMQYTGLKDKNGVEIYEGDIAKTDGEIFGSVIFKDGGFCFDTIDENDCDFISNYTVEIIGNIHENRDLIGKN